MGSVSKLGHSWDLQKIESPGGGGGGGGTRFLLERVDKLEKGIDVEMSGLSRFLLIYSSITFTLSREN